MGLLEQESAANLRAELESYGDALVPGAARELAGYWAGRTGTSREAAAAYVAGALANPIYAKFKNPEYAPPAGPNGTPASELRLALMRRSDDLKLGGVDELHKRLALESAGKTPDQVAKIVAKALDDRANADVLMAMPAGTIHERSADRYRELAKRHFAVGDIDRFAADMATDHPINAATPNDEIVRTIAARLRDTRTAAHYRATPVTKEDDWRERWVSKESKEAAAQPKRPPSLAG